MIDCKDRVRNDLYCVEWVVKLYSNQTKRKVECKYQTAARRVVNSAPADLTATSPPPPSTIVSTAITGAYRRELHGDGHSANTAHTAVTPRGWGRSSRSYRDDGDKSYGNTADIWGDNATNRSVKTANYSFLQQPVRLFCTHVGTSVYLLDSHQL